MKVQVWIYFRASESSEPSFLILKMLPDRGGHWQPVTGSVEQGETLVQAARRESQEESGLSFVGDPIPIGEPFEFESRWGQKVTEYGFALQATSQAVHLDPQEHTDYRWVSGAEAIQSVGYPSNAQMLKSFLRQLV